MHCTSHGCQHIRIKIAHPWLRQHASGLAQVDPCSGAVGIGADTMAAWGSAARCNVIGFRECDWAAVAGDLLRSCALSVCLDRMLAASAGVVPALCSTDLGLDAVKGFFCPVLSLACSCGSESGCD